MMTRDKLKHTHKLYDKNIAGWKMRIAAYEGIDALLDWGALIQNERESDDNYKARLAEAIGFEYTPAIIELFACYLFEKPAQREVDPLNSDDLWQMFVDDCDMMGTSINSFMAEQQRYAAVYGHVGILVDKARTKAINRQDELKSKLYPYLTIFHPQNILDWAWDRDASGRPFLSYLKLIDDDEQYRIWNVDGWEIWRIVADKEHPELIDKGDNPLGEIPFIWLYNRKSRQRGIGNSDVTGVARIDASIVRNLSQGEEVIKYAAFPMMRRPMKRAGEGEDTAGVTAVLEFDPTMPESKPDWLEASCAEPVGAVLDWIDKKVAEIYRSVNAGGLQATETSTQAKSGLALKYEFQQLNSKLKTKANALDEAEMGIIWYWMKWQGLEKQYDKIQVRRPKTFSVEDLATDLENALVAKTVIGSEKFTQALSKRIVRQSLPGASEEELTAIDEDIEKGPALITLPGDE